MIRRIFRLLFGGALVLVATLCLTLFAAIDATPLVQRGDVIDPSQIAQAKRLFDANDPRRLDEGEQRSVSIPLPLLDTAAHHLARLGLRGQAALSLQDNLLQLDFTRPFPGFATHYLNIRVTLRPGSSEPRLNSLRIGHLPLPAALGDAAAKRMAELAGFAGEWTLALHSIRRLSFDSTAQNIRVDYTWQPELVRSVRRAALPADDVARMKRAHEALVAAFNAAPPDCPLPLGELLPPLFANLGDNSRAQMRATLLVLATYLAEKNIATLAPEAYAWPPLRPVAIKLRGRYDSAQHFTVSAALAAWAGEPVADAIGVWKEIDDIRHSSGFSFADLAADRAGTRFGTLLADAPETLRTRLSKPLAEDDFVPRIDDLPEYLGETEFQRRFGTADRKRSQAFAAMQDQIESRVRSLSLYR